MCGVLAIDQYTSFLLDQAVTTKRRDIVSNKDQEHLLYLLDEEVADLLARAAVHRAFLNILVNSYLTQQDADFYRQFGFILDATVKNLAAESGRSGEGGLPTETLEDELRGILGKFVYLLPT